MIRPLRAIVFALVAAAAVLTARPAFAGPPLLCEPFEIGTARSLPFALLNGRTGVMVRMETLRRATIYAATRPLIAAELLKKLEDRANAKAPLAAFDYGYLVEALREAESVFKRPPATDLK